MASEAGSFDFWLRFGSVTGVLQTCSFVKASPKPNLGLALKSPAPNGYSIFLSALVFQIRASISFISAAPINIGYAGWLAQ
jgi:hypothetical protein